MDNPCFDCCLLDKLCKVEIVDHANACQIFDVYSYHTETSQLSDDVDLICNYFFVIELLSTFIMFISKLVINFYI